jgi:hypothetical protein
MQKKILIFSLFVFSFLLPSTYALRFADDPIIPTWAVDAVDAVQEQKIMTGFGDNTFRPNKVLNRAEALVILFRLKRVNLDEIGATGNTKFKDVPLDAWYSKAVGEAVEREWITGFPDGTFRPGNNLNRAEWATLIMRAFGLEREENPGYTDVPSKAWFSKSIFTLVANDLVRERSSKFNPSDPVDRADAAWMAAKILRKPRLMGDSSYNDFASYAQRVDSRRVAIKPRDFNPYFQGYEIETKQLSMNVIPKEDEVLIRMDSDWVDLGTIRIKNTLDDRVELHSLELKMLFEETNVGPRENFMFRLRGMGIEKEVLVGRTGNIFISGIGTAGGALIGPDAEFVLRAYIKPTTDKQFYGSEGYGKISLFLATGSMISTFIKENPDRNGTYRNAPIKFESRDFTKILFRP